MRATTHPVIGVVTTIASAATICLAGYWEFEQVDSGSIGSYVAIDKMSDGTIWLAYVNGDSAIRLAHKDSVWEYEDLDTALVRPKLPWAYFIEQPLSFDIGPDDVAGLVGMGRLAEHRDSGWSAQELPMPMGGVFMSYDPYGRPSLTFKDSLGNVCFGLKTDSGWDTSVVWSPYSGYTWWIRLSRPAWQQNGDCAFMEGDFWDLGGVIDGDDVTLFVRDSGVWTSYTKAIGHDGDSVGFAALVDSIDSIHTFWAAGDPYGTNELVCDTFRLDGFTDLGAACLDTSGRVQCTWIRGGLRFAVPGRETWVVQDTGNPAWCDITTDALSQPVIAYCTSDGSIWVARGVGIVGLSDEQGGSVVRSLPRAASIVSGVLYLPRDMTETGSEVSDRVPRPTLLDACGRKVMDLRPGANNVCRLAPGVYFVREGGGSREQGGAGVRKVLVAR